MCEGIERYVQTMTDEITVKRCQTFSKAIIGEIKEIATANGIRTEVELNEPYVLELIRKATPKKPQLTGKDAICDCGMTLMRDGIKNSLIYCECCGQKIDWSEYDASCE